MELLNEFDVEDIVVVDKDNEGSTFRRLNTDELDMWLNDYSLGDLWKKNILGAGFRDEKCICLLRRANRRSFC